MVKVATIDHSILVLIQLSEHTRDQGLVQGLVQDIDRHSGSRAGATVELKGLCNCRGRYEHTASV